MPRTRSFDESYVIEQAMETFWSQGYEATSVDDLVAATGLSKSSLYGAFGNKRSLFDRTLDFYVNQRVDSMLGGLETGEGGADEVIAFFDLYERITMEYPERAALGCLLTNSVTEMGFSDAAVRNRADAYIDRLAGAFASALTRSEARDELAPGHAGERGQILATLALGLFVRGRGSLDPTGPQLVASAVRSMVNSWRCEVA